jgi:hypothetical protein
MFIRRTAQEQEEQEQAQESGQGISATGQARSRPMTQVEPNHPISTGLLSLHCTQSCGGRNSPIVRLAPGRFLSVFSEMVGLRAEIASACELTRSEEE